MAIIEQPRTIVALPAGAGAPALVTPKEAKGMFARPVEPKGWRDWVFTVDHKKIGIM